MDFSWFIPAALFAIAVGLLLGYIVRTVGMPCPFCKNRKTTPFLELPEPHQTKLLDYFHTYEARTPDQNGIFVCQSCKTVFDDFSGEKKSLETDLWGPRVFCKICNNIMIDCNLENENIQCRHCKTKYQWLVHETSGFRILMPPPDAEVLKKCNDYTFGTM